MIDHINPDWSSAVWLNVLTSICVVICVSTWLTMGWVRRNRFNMVQDAERIAITFVLLGMLAFFTTRAIDVGRAGMTIATPWLLSSGAFLSVACLVCTAIVLRKHDEYGVLSNPRWKPGDPDRRSGQDRRKTNAQT